MEYEQIGKRLEWLDEQQRLSKTNLGDFGSRLTSLETSVNALSQQIKTLTKELAALSPLAARVNQFEELLSKQRADLAKLVETNEKNAIRREQDGAKLHHTELEELRKSIFQVSNSINIEEINKKFKDRAHEEQRLGVMVQDMRASVEAAVAQSKEVAQAQKAMEDARRQDAKRLADVQGELAAVRKRAEDAREKATVHTDGIRNLENRIHELLGSETGRQEEQTSFLAQQAIAQVERDRIWKDWQGKFDAIQQQSETMESQVATLDESIRAAKRAQESYNELNQKLERRIAEVGEMQRLAEDRVRQEWVAFKADEQKRWTGHSLTQEETMRDFRKAVDKVEHRMTALEDVAQTVQDQVHQTSDTTEKQLQELMNVAHEWLTAYERIMGHGKSKPKKTAR